MARDNKYIALMLGVILVAFAGGIVALFDLSFETGDVYPPYSSYRSDPLGARALYESLDDLQGVSTRRNIRPFTELESGNGRTLIFTGANLSRDPEDVIERLEAFVAEGGRLVIAFFPVGSGPCCLENVNEDFKKKIDELAEESKKSQDEPDEPIKEEEEKEGKEEASKPPPKKENQEAREEKSEDDEGEDGAELFPFTPNLVSVDDRWGFSFQYKPLSGDTTESFGEGKALLSDLDKDWLPPKLSWHSALYFGDPAPAWRVLYEREGDPVIMERDFGQGTIVLSSDSYFISNEAMRTERRPHLLAWMVGPSSDVIFDEFHFGIARKEGTMTLMRKYRIHALLIALIIAAVLYIWKNASSLTPKRDPAEENVETGKDATAGLVNLLKRSVPASTLLTVCLDEWKRSLGRPNERTVRKTRAVEQVVAEERNRPLGDGNLARAYVRICRIVAERK